MLEDWRTDFDWTDPEDGPASWDELDRELEKKKAPWDRSEAQQTLKVRFVNSSSVGCLRSASVVRQELCDQTLMPLLVIRDPWNPQETLTCRWYDNEWVHES